MAEGNIFPTQSKEVLGPVYGFQHPFQGPVTSGFVEGQAEMVSLP